MIVYPAKHIFEARYPSLEEGEKEIFYQHPVHDLKCNQLGIVYYDPSVIGFYISKGYDYLKYIDASILNKVIGPKTRIVWECYTGKTTEANKFFYLNGNTLDLRYENLLLKSETPKALYKELALVEREFSRKSVEHLLGLELRMEKLGFTKEELWEMILIPNWVRAERRKYKTPLEKKKKELARKPYIRITEEHLENIRRCKNEGLTSKEIAEKLNENYHRVRTIIRKYGL